MSELSKAEEQNYRVAVAVANKEPGICQFCNGSGLIDFPVSITHPYGKGKCEICKGNGLKPKPFKLYQRF